MPTWSNSEESRSWGMEEIVAGAVVAGVMLFDVRSSVKAEAESSGEMHDPKQALGILDSMNAKRKVMEKGMRRNDLQQTQKLNNGGSRQVHGGK